MMDVAMGYLEMDGVIKIGDRKIQSKARAIVERAAIEAEGWSL
jgi:hypothetical protein